MNFRVIWQEIAQNQLVELLAHGHDLAALTRSLYRVDALLEYDALNIGESRPPDRRVLIDPPLVVYYRVVADEVHILSLHRRRTT